MQKFINFLCCIVLVFGVWLPSVLKLFQHCGVHCGHHLQSDCEVWEASQLGIRGRVVVVEHCVTKWDGTTWFRRFGGKELMTFSAEF